jgi:hypothetical protein
MKQKSLKKYFMLLLPVVICAFTSCISCKKPKPIPENKKAFIGSWVAPGGFKMEIKSSGTADVFEDHLSSDPINDTLKIGITLEYSKNMLVEFGGDSLIIISQPLVRAREYHINKNPFQDGDTCKMILNGVLFIKKIE